MKKVISVLHVVPSLSKCSGISRFVYNMTKQSDPERVRYDFLHQAQLNGSPIYSERFDEELEEAGHKVFRVENAGRYPLHFIRQSRHLIQLVGNKYDVIHCHMPNAAFSVLRDAKRCGIEIRVLHSHLNSSSDNAIHRMRNAPLVALGKRYANGRVACSSDAGEYLFGDSSYEVIENGISLGLCAYSVESSRNLRRTLGIPLDAPVVGCVGRHVKQKNFGFAVDVFASLYKKLPNAHMVFLGDGALRNELEEKASRSAACDSIHFAGIRSNAAEWYSVFDCLLMPSLYEGLPVSAVEAQASCLPCVYSTNVPRETDVTHTGTFMPLEAPVSEWVEAIGSILKTRRRLDIECISLLERAGFSAEYSSKKLMDYYDGLVSSGKAGSQV